MGAEEGLTDDAAGERAGSMADRLYRAGRESGLGADGATTLRATFLATLADRPGIDPRDPAFLHPARNVLILLEDLGVRDPVELLAAIRFDGARPPLGSAEPAVAALLEAVPRDDDVDDKRLLEDLVTAVPGAARIALADRLDHARHLHLTPADRWTTFHARVQAVWLPAAERTDPVLGRRFRWWTRMFARRWLPSARP